ncbi:MAG: TatD family hydrolase [Zetaproteobacteria bacterium]|nr:TatD family hydrolase [Zetaproteobacteria bacterium]
MALFDSHCHLDFPHFDADREEVLARMASVGVEGALAVAVDLHDLSRLRALSESVANIWFSVGVHPNHTCEREPTFDQLVSLANHPKCKAIGETGIDLYHHRVDLALQEARFRIHIAAAKQVDLPLIVHMRDADADTLRVMQDADVRPCGGVMHCFSSSWEVAKACIDLGMSISFSGNVTFKRNEELRNVARQIPDKYLLVETDSPYLAPEPYRGQRNEPSYVAQVAACVADARGISIEALMELTTNNAKQRFRLI